MLGGIEEEQVTAALGRSRIFVRDMDSGLTVEVPPEYVSFSSSRILLVSKTFAPLCRFAGNRASVQFYVNRVGYCFDTLIQDSTVGLALSVPKDIRRVKDTDSAPDAGFSAELSYLDVSGSPLVLPCSVLPSYPLLERPLLSVLPESRQDECRAVINALVNERKNEPPSLIGSGMQLLPAAAYLTDPDVRENLLPVHGTQPPLDLIYIDCVKVVFGKRKYAQELELEGDYRLRLEVMLSALLRRRIQLDCTVCDIYASPSSGVKCYACTVTGLKAEDGRFISARMEGGR